MCIRDSPNPLLMLRIHLRNANAVLVFPIHEGHGQSPVLPTSSTRVAITLGTHREFFPPASHPPAPRHPLHWNEFLARRNQPWPSKEFALGSPDLAYMRSSASCRPSPSRNIVSSPRSPAATPSTPAPPRNSSASRMLLPLLPISLDVPMSTLFSSLPLTLSISPTSPRLCVPASRCSARSPWQ